MATSHSWAFRATFRRRAFGWSGTRKAIAGRVDEAYARYGINATSANTNIATYRAIAKRYPGIDPHRILGDLIASTPGEEGKWFATAKTLKQYDLAIGLAQRAPVDPKTAVASARIAESVAGHGASARWVRQCLGLDAA